jgi:phage-related protein
VAEHEVKTELKLEDHMSEALHHIGEGFEALDEKVVEAGHEILEMFKNAAGVALGFQLEGAIEGVKELGHEAFEAAAGMEEQEKAIRGVLAMIDEEGASLEELGGEAHELNERFAELGETTGQAKSSVVSAFDEMAERTGLATKDVEALTEQMANAGKAVPGGIEALSEGFSNLSSGIIRAKNPIVQMIAATGMLHGNAKQVADQMKKMSPQQAMQLGIDAVEKMGDKMKGLPLTFGELVTSLKGIREEIFESLGAPVLKALTGPLDRLRSYFDDHKQTIMEWAEAVGDKVGEWVNEAADEFEEGFHWLEDHAEEIKKAFSEGAQAIKDVVKFIIDHREAIAAAFGGKMLLDKAGGLAEAGTKAASGLVSTVGGLAEGGSEAAAAGIMEALNPVALAATAAAAVVLAAAVATVYGAFEDLTDETSKYYDEANADLEQIKANFSEAWDELTSGSDSVGEQLKELAEWMGKEFLDDLVTISEIAIDAAQAFNMLAEAVRITLYPIKLLLNELGIFTDSIQGSALAKREGGHGTLGAVGGEKPETSAIKAPPVYNFTGEIHINQDFKDTDPDRIATVFKQSLGRAAQSRVSASTQVPQSNF